MDQDKWFCRTPRWRQHPGWRLLNSASNNNPFPLSGLPGGGFRGDGTNPSGELLTKHTLVRPPRGGWRHRGPRRRRGSHANRSSRILNSMQTSRVCRSMIITLTESGGASKQCRQPQTPPPILKLGLLPFLIARYLLKSSRRVATCSLRRTSLQELPLHHPRGVRVFWEGIAHFPGYRDASPGLRSRLTGSTCRPWGRSPALLHNCRG
jgi:hypothetical protein